MVSGNFRDRGNAGADLYDYLDGWHCHGFRQTAAVQDLLDHREYPYAFDWGGDPGACIPPAKRSPPLNIEVVVHGTQADIVVVTRRAGRLEVVLAGSAGGTVDLGAVEAGDRIELALPAPEAGEVVRGGATLRAYDGSRWHAPIRRPAGAPFEPLPAGVRTVWGPMGELLEWPSTPDRRTRADSPSTAEPRTTAHPGRRPLSE